MREYYGYDIEKLEKDIANCYDDDLYNAVYQYCESIGYELPFDQYTLEEIISSMDPEEAFRLGMYSDISLNGDMYIYNGYGNLEETSINEFVNDYRDESDFPEFIIDNGLFDDIGLDEEDYYIEDEYSDDEYEESVADYERTAVPFNK